jgi:hypothetical protein
VINEWRKYNDKKIKEAGTKNSPSGPSPDGPETNYRTTCATVRNTDDGYTNMRSGPAVSSQIVTQLHPGDLVSVLEGKVNNWQHVSFSGSDGWVFTKYIQPVQCQSATHPLRGEVESNCDSLAANPNDQRRSGNGVPYDELGTHAADAVEACTKAVEANGKELRFQYQLGRALEFVNRPKAMEIHNKLVKAKYPAAYDNLGWMMYWDKKDAAQAVNYFRMGVELGDPDSMVSLADMIDRGEYTPPNADYLKMALYKRAANLGHAGAVRLEQQQQVQWRFQQRPWNEQEMERAMLEAFGTVLRSIPRR